MVVSNHQSRDSRVGQERKVTEDEARETVRRFLLDRYPRAKVQFETVRLVTEQDRLAYCLEGKIEVRTGTLVSQFLWPPDRYAFKMWVSATGGRIVRWELN